MLGSRDSGIKGEAQPCSIGRIDTGDGQVPRAPVLRDMQRRRQLGTAALMLLSFVLSAIVVVVGACCFLPRHPLRPRGCEPTCQPAIITSCGVPCVFVRHIVYHTGRAVGKRWLATRDTDHAPVLHHASVA